MRNNEILDLAGLLAAALTSARKFGDTVPWWRGQSDCGWPLVPSVFRNMDNGERYEQNVAGRFVQKAATRSANCPPRTELDSWLFLMQHYGLPTRIMDWTESVLVAAYFAVRQERHYDKPGVIWALAPAALNQEQIGRKTIVGTGSDPAPSLFRRAFEGAATTTSQPIIAIGANQFDIRRLVQLSEFTLHGEATPLDELSNHDKFLSKYLVPPAAKPVISQTLKLLCFNESNLFPDLDHLASEIKSLSFSV